MTGLLGFGDLHERSSLSDAGRTRATWLSISVTSSLVRADWERSLTIFGSWHRLNPARSPSRRAKAALRRHGEVRHSVHAWPRPVSRRWPAAAARNPPAP